MIREDIRKRSFQEKVVKMAPKHQSVAVQRGATMKSHSYSKYGFIFRDTGPNVTSLYV